MKFIKKLNFLGRLLDCGSLRTLQDSLLQKERLEQRKAMIKKYSILHINWIHNSKKRYINGQFYKFSAFAGLLCVLQGGILWTFTLYIIGFLKLILILLYL